MRKQNERRQEKKIKHCTLSRLSEITVCNLKKKQQKRKKKMQSLNTLPTYDKNNYRPKDETSTSTLSEDIKNQYQLFS